MLDKQRHQNLTWKDPPLTIRLISSAHRWHHGANGTRKRLCYNDIDPRADAANMAPAQTDWVLSADYRPGWCVLLTSFALFSPCWSGLLNTNIGQAIWCYISWVAGRVGIYLAQCPFFYCFDPVVVIAASSKRTRFHAGHNGIWPRFVNTAMQILKAVTAYFSSEQLLHFGFAEKTR